MLGISSANIKLTEEWSNSKIQVWKYSEMSKTETMLDVAPGYVYVMMTKTCPNPVKNGTTTRTPEERIRELSSETEPLNPQEVEHSVYTQTALASALAQVSLFQFPQPSGYSAPALSD
jgi:hypothetical protein